MKATTFIFARGGSKGLVGKNILPLLGKPLLGWSIEHAFAVKRIERVIVSTDSIEIADVAITYGAEVPFIRPKELASDNSPEWLAWKHALHYLLESDGVLPEAMVSLPATAPLRQTIDIENCLDEFECSGADIVVTVTDSHRSPYFNMVSIDSTGRADLVIKPNNVVSRRQDVPDVYDITTVCYVARPDFVLSHNSIFEGNIRAVHVPVERSIDIDTPLDFQIAKCILGDKSK